LLIESSFHELQKTLSRELESGSCARLQKESSIFLSRGEEMFHDLFGVHFLLVRIFHIVESHDFVSMFFVIACAGRWKFRNELPPPGSQSSENLLFIIISSLSIIVF
jgi:hypothetical protein